MLLQNREGENGAVPSRCDRFYVFENEWFFNTREGSPIGPYTTHESAMIGMRDYIEFLQLAKPKIRAQLIAAMTPQEQIKETDVKGANTKVTRIRITKH